MVNGKSCITLQTDLNKAFDCIVHDFLIVKFDTCSVVKLKAMLTYFTEKKHKTEFNFSFSHFLDLLIGVPQGLIKIQLKSNLLALPRTN